MGCLALLDTLGTDTRARELMLPHYQVCLVASACLILQESLGNHHLLMDFVDASKVLTKTPLVGSSCTCDTQLHMSSLPPWQLLRTCSYTSPLNAILSNRCSITLSKTFHIKFDIVVASEISAVLALVRALPDLHNKMGSMVMLCTHLCPRPYSGL